MFVEVIYDIGVIVVGVYVCVFCDGGEIDEEVVVGSRFVLVVVYYVRGYGDLFFYYVCVCEDGIVGIVC